MHTCQNLYLCIFLLENPHIHISKSVNHCHTLSHSMPCTTWRTVAGAIEGRKRGRLPERKEIKKKRNEQASYLLFSHPALLLKVERLLVCTEEPLPHRGRRETGRKIGGGGGRGVRGGWEVKRRSWTEGGQTDGKG